MKSRTPHLAIDSESNGRLVSACNTSAFAQDCSAVWLGAVCVKNAPMDKTFSVTVDGTITEAKPQERLVDLLNRTGTKISQVCYHPQLGPIQTCDTCMVEADGKLVRACATIVAAGIDVSTKSARATAGQREAFDRILGNHLLYCTVCDNNNGNCTVHNTTKLLAVE